MFVQGPADVAMPLVDAWAAENSGLWDTHLRVDLDTYAYRRTMVLPWAVAANLLAAVNPWRYRPRTLRMRIAWYRRIVQQRKVLLRLHNAHGATVLRWFVGGAPGSLVLVTARTRLSNPVDRVVRVNLRPARLIEGPLLPGHTTLDSEQHHETAQPDRLVYAGRVEPDTSRRPTSMKPDLVTGTTPPDTVRLIGRYTRHEPDGGTTR